jgi:hypothetical protein
VNGERRDLGERLEPQQLDPLSGCRCCGGRLFSQHAGREQCRLRDELQACALGDNWVGTSLVLILRALGAIVDVLTAWMCTVRADVMARTVGTTDPGTAVQTTFDRSRLLHRRKYEASIADSVSVRVPPSCVAEFVVVPAYGGSVLALPGYADLLATQARRTDPRRTALASASLEANITRLTDTSRAAETASPARRRGAARSPRRELRTLSARTVPTPNSQPSPSV